MRLDQAFFSFCPSFHFFPCIICFHSFLLTFFLSFFLLPSYFFLHSPFFLSFFPYFSSVHLCVFMWAGGSEGSSGSGWTLAGQHQWAAGIGSRLRHEPWWTGEPGYCAEVCVCPLGLFTLCVFLLTPLQFTISFCAAVELMLRDRSGVRFITQAWPILYNLTEKVEAEAGLF